LKDPPPTFEGAIILEIADFWIKDWDEDKSPETVSADFPHALFDKLPPVDTQS
jgi:hypothetical protein